MQQEKQRKYKLKNFCCYWHLFVKLLKNVYITKFSKYIQPRLIFSSECVCYICQNKTFYKHVHNILRLETNEQISLSP